MPWLQVRFNTTTQLSEKLETGLEEFGACSVTLKDSKDQPIFEPGPGETPLWDNIELTALFPEDFTTTILINWLEENGIDKSLVAIEELQDENWQEKWMEDFHPIRFGQRLWVVPSWIDPPEPEAVNIILDPGLAFGSGTHPTTALCLEWLDEHDLEGKNLIDYGCGSGILAIAAVKLGAGKVWALDNDPQALESCRMNAEQNGVSEQINIISPDQYPRDQKMDVVMANILATPLVELKERFLFMAEKKASLVMSGILEEQVPLIKEAYNDSLSGLATSFKGDWARISGKVENP